MWGYWRFMAHKGHCDHKGKREFNFVYLRNPLAPSGFRLSTCLELPLLLIRGLDLL